MEAYLLLEEDKFIEIKLENVDGIFSFIEYNPFPGENGLLGFYLKANKIYPVVDLNDLLKINRGDKSLYLQCGGVVFLISYKKLSSQKTGEEKIELSEIAKGILERLGAA